jgi:hypothetical protein
MINPFGRVFCHPKAFPCPVQNVGISGNSLRSGKSFKA